VVAFRDTRPGIDERLPEKQIAERHAIMGQAYAAGAESPLDFHPLGFSEDERHGFAGALRVRRPRNAVLRSAAGPATEDIPKPNAALLARESRGLEHGPYLLAADLLPSYFGRVSKERIVQGHARGRIRSGCRQQHRRPHEEAGHG